jgi:hypothetical protein
VSLSTSLRSAVGAILAGALLLVPGSLLAGCSSSVPGTASPQNTGAGTSLQPTTDPPPQTVGPTQPVTGGCKVTIGRGNVTISGGGGRAVTSNGSTSFSCRTGPLIAVGQITDNAVSFTVDGKNATVTVSSTVGVGGYNINVVSIVNGVATLQVVPTG